MRQEHEGGRRTPRRLTTKQRIVATASVVALSAAALWGGGYAAWQSGDTEQQGLSTATLTAAFDDGTSTFSAPVTNLVAGDYLDRYTDLRNTGTIGQAFTLNVAALANTLTGVDEGLKVNTEACTVAWTRASDECQGDVTPVMGLEDAYIGGGKTGSPFNLGPEQVAHLRFRFTLPANADQTKYQGQTDTIQVTATGVATVGPEGRDRS
jgi:hypothetical protein